MEKSRLTSYRYEYVLLIICIALCLGANTLSFAQNSPYDNQVLQEARDFLDLGRTVEANAKFESLVEKYCRNSGDSVLCFEAKMGLHSIAMRNGNNERVELILKELSSFVSMRLNEAYYHALLAKGWLFHSIRINDLDQASDFANRIDEIIEKGADGDSLALAAAHDAIGYYEDMLGNYKDAIHHYNLAIKMANNVNSFEKMARLLLHTHNNLGVSYKNMGMLEEAKREYEMSLDLSRNLYNDKNADEAGTLINLGSIYYSEGDVGLAAEYFQRSVEIYRELSGDFSRQIGASLNNLAASHYILKNYDRSAKYFEEAQRIKEENLGFDHPETAIGYSNLAAIHILNEDFHAARENIVRSITVREAIYGSDHPNLIDPLIRLGNLYNRHFELYEEARTHYESALAIANDRLGENHPDVTDIYLQIGNTYIKDGMYLNAGRYLDNAIENLYGPYDFDREIDLERAITNPVTLVLALSYKARLLKERNEEISVRDHQHALMALDWAADLVDVLQLSFKSEASKLQLVESNYSIYTDAVEIIAELYEETGNDEYKDKIFEIIEKSRSRVTLELIHEINARNYAGVPDNILEEESTLNSEITRLQQQIYLEESEVFERDEGRVIAIRDSIFQHKRKLEEFTDKLETEYPSYYSLKYDQTIINRHEAQSLLRDNEVALSYVLGAEQAYVLVTSKEALFLAELGKSSDISSLVLDLKEQVLRSDTDAYKQTAYQLYKLLMHPVEQFISGKKLLVMADQELHYLPFELLLKKVPDHNQFHKFPYIVHEYTISYIPSLTLLNEMNTRKAENPRNLLALAPFSSEIAQQDMAFMDHRYSNSAKPLHLTQYETVTISSRFQSRRSLGEYFRPQQAELLLGDKATFSRFSEKRLYDYDYLHFATHAFINEDNPEYSAILLYPEEENSGVTYVGDIYSLELSASLVVLGACQTGMGSNYKGEGLIGFTRAFIYAGASNLAVSMWRVSDQPTAFLMIDFYDYIRQGFTYSEALQKAKLNIIKKPHLANPVNWAAFVLNGR